MKLILEGMDIV